MFFVCNNSPINELLCLHGLGESTHRSDTIWSWRFVWECWNKQRHSVVRHRGAYVFDISIKRLTLLWFIIAFLAVVLRKRAIVVDCYLQTNMSLWSLGCLSWEALKIFAACPISQYVSFIILTFSCSQVKKRQWVRRWGFGLVFSV